MAGNLKARTAAEWLRARLRGAQINRAVICSGLSSVWSVFGGALILLLLTRYADAEEQGYYYTFAALLSVQMFIDCGLGVALAQFVSHEAVHLDAAATPEAEHGRHRLGHLIRVGMLGYGAAAAAFLVLAGTGGWAFFSAFDDQRIAWQAPWAAACAATAFAMVMQPLSSVLEGAGRVGANQSALLLGTVLGYAGGVTALVLGHSLYVPALVVGLRTAAATPLLLVRAHDLLRLALASGRGGGALWRHEFWPLQRRVAISWLCGVGMISSFVPITFHIAGPAVSGQVGALLQLVQAVNRLASAWLVPAQPMMGRLGALGDWDGLKRLVEGTTVRCVLTASLAAGGGIVLLSALSLVMPAIGERIGSLSAQLAFLAQGAAMQAATAPTAAIRAQKREPYLALAVVSTLTLPTLVAVGALTAGTEGVAFTFLGARLLLLLPWELRIYRQQMPAISGIPLDQPLFEPRHWLRGARSMVSPRRPRVGA